MKIKVKVFKGMFNPIPDIFKVNVENDYDMLSLIKSWDGYHACSFITDKKKNITYGAGQIRKVIIKTK